MNIPSKNNFWIEKKLPFKNKKMQMWTIESIYYECIKLLLRRFKYNTSKIATYLKKLI